MTNNHNLYQIKLDDIRALVIDIDGTLWRGSVPMPGLVDFFNFLYRHAISFVIVTNNSIETPAHYRQKLAGFGISIELENILTCSVATASYLAGQFGNGLPAVVGVPAGQTAYIIGETGLREAVAGVGFNLLEDATHPADVVIVGGDRGLTYDKLKHATLLIQRGAMLVGSNPDLLVPTEEGLVPEAGTTLAAIQAATGVKPVVIGKPGRLLFDMALTKMGVLPAQTAMVGDRLDTDILGGQQVGLKTILVTTGVDNENSIPQKRIRPDAIFSGLDQLVKSWKEAICKPQVASGK